MSEILTYLLPAVISMGYFSVCLSNSKSGEPLKSGTSMKAALVFGATALGLFMAGYYSAGLLEERMEGYQKWIVMAMLLLVSYRMVMHGWKKRASVKVFDINLFPVIFAMALALGINALFSGVAIRFMDLSLQKVSALLGGMVFFFSFSGLLYGRQFGDQTGRTLEMVSGIVLVILSFAWYGQTVF